MILALNIAAYVALALAAWAAFRGGPSAGALVASNIAARAASLFGVEFDMVIWVAIDITVIVFILFGAIGRGRLLRREFAIMALFIVAWRFYWLPEKGLPNAEVVQFTVVTCVVIAQLMLTLPWRWIGHIIATKLGVASGEAPDRLEARCA